MEEEKDYLYVFTNGATHGFTLRCYDVSSGTRTPTVLFEEIMNGYITWTNNFYVGINGTNQRYHADDPSNLWSRTTAPSGRARTSPAKRRRRSYSTKKSYYLLVIPKKKTRIDTIRTTPRRRTAPAPASPARRRRASQKRLGQPSRRPPRPSARGLLNTNR